MNSSSHTPSQRCRSVRGLALKVLDFWMVCMLYSTLCSVSAEPSRLRCGTELLADLVFVCGDRGIYLGKHNWSGYGPRPRGKGIVDHCCKPGGCDLQHLEMYCAPANPRDRPQTTTADPSSTLPPTTRDRPQTTADPTSTLPPTTRDRPQTTADPTSTLPPTTTSLSTTTTTTTSPSTTNTTNTTTTNTTTTTTITTQLAVTQQQFETVFQKRLLQQLGAPGSLERQAYRRTSTQNNPQRRANRGSRRRTHGTPEPPRHSPLSTSPSPLPGTPQPS